MQRAKFLFQMQVIDISRGWVLVLRHADRQTQVHTS